MLTSTIIEKKIKKFKNILSCEAELKLLAKTKNAKKREEILKSIESCVINSISEIAHNCLKGNIPLKTCDFNKLKKLKKVLVLLSTKSPVNKRRKLLIQKGGQLFPLLIPPALSLISSIIGSLVSKKISK